MISDSIFFKFLDLMLKGMYFYIGQYGEYPKGDKYKTYYIEIECDDGWILRYTPESKKQIIDVDFYFIDMVHQYMPELSEEFIMSKSLKWVRNNLDKWE